MLEILENQLEAGILRYPSILVLFIIFGYLIYRIIRNLSFRSSEKSKKEFEQLLGSGGYAYDSEQGIFYSMLNAWQRNFGYCRLYDEAAAAAGMILDMEPVRFKYGGKKWLIEFWKGQYCLNTGGEIGVYYTKESDLFIPKLFKGTFYQCVSNSDRLDMSYVLLKNGKELFRRSGKHWWLSGFKPGEFSDPWELTMKIRIVFKDTKFCRNFVKALKKLGYQKREISVNGTTVEFLFDKPRSPQPVTRTEEIDWIIQKNNARICNRYQELTVNHRSWSDKLKAVQRKDPFLYESLINIGKTRQVFKAFDKLKAAENRNFQRRIFKPGEIKFN